jgi:phage terminase large subunit GpA-like protein
MSSSNASETGRCTRSRAQQGCAAIRSTPTAEPGRRSAKRLRSGRPPEILGIDSIKRTVYAYLAAEEGKPGYCHFPVGRSDEYYDQLTGERLEVLAVRGKRPERRWKPIHQNVEALDARVYAYAAMLLHDCTDRMREPTAGSPGRARSNRTSGQSTRGGSIPALLAEVVAHGWPSGAAVRWCGRADEPLGNPRRTGRSLYQKFLNGS